MTLILIIILGLNTLWFLAAFNLFSIRSTTAAKILLRKENRIEPFIDIVSQLTKFLGGMNLALAFFTTICILDFKWLLTYRLNYAILIAFFIAHMSQFWFNVPLALKEKNNEHSLWPVLTGTMKFIFVGDIFLAICNFALAIYLFMV